MTILAKIVAAVCSAFIMVVTIPLTIIALIVDMINSVRNEVLTINNTAEIWQRWNHLFEMINNGEI